MLKLVLRIIEPLQMEPPKRDKDGTTDADGNYIPPLYPKIKSETGAACLDVIECMLVLTNHHVHNWTIFATSSFCHRP